MSKIKSRTKIRIFVGVIIILAMFLAIVDFPALANNSIGQFHTKDFHLGLDLQGGTHLVYEADVSGVEAGEEGAAMEGLRDVIERRVNDLGVSEPLVQVNRSGEKWRVIVELAGIKDVKEAIGRIGDTPLLEFKEQNTEKSRDLTAEEKQQMDAYNKDAKARADEVLQKALAGEDFNELVKNYSEDEDTKNNNGEIGYVSENSFYAEFHPLVKDLSVGETAPSTVENPDGINIVKVLDKRDGPKEVDAAHVLICYKDALYCEQDISKDEAKAKIEEIKAQAAPENFSQLAKDNSDDLGSKENGGDLGWFSEEMMVEPFAKAAFNLADGQISDIVETDYGYHLIYKKSERVEPEFKIARILIKTQSESDYVPPIEEWANTGLSGKQLKRSSVQFDPNTNAPQVGLEFNDEGKTLFAEITKRNVGNPVAIYLDNSPISVPRVNEAISDGRAVISGNFSIQEAKLLSQRLNAGALPVPVQLVSQQTVGATLGGESLNKSLFAGMIGLIAVALFMILFYRLPGLLAVIALLVYGVLVLFLFKYIPVTLTLSGIAGFLLSIGMAVDANVLIFERMKEEVRDGKPLDLSIREGFKRAWSSIRDGNLSTLITCFILAWFGTSMIRGFAITLSVGILVSMFSAIVITRQFLKVFITPKNQNKSKVLWLFGVKKRS
ncbi:MAG TPA: protein translocase subunit SecD [Candidatus Bipolaricaulota bacterium]|nr:protein translocase subunit SecD [Candidatus Bipolaricaulota bacterium]